MDELGLDLQLLEASFGKVIALLAKYPILNLSLSFNNVFKKIFLTQLYVEKQEQTIDARDVQALEDNLNWITKKVTIKQGRVAYGGSTLACEIYLLNPLILKVLNQLKLMNANEDYLQYYELLSKYILLCGQYVNQSFMVDETIY